MHRLSGRHRLAGSGRRLNYWALFDGVADGVYYEAIVTEDGALLALPEFVINANGEETTTRELVRRHLVDYLDAMHFGRGRQAQPAQSGLHAG